MSYSGYMYFLIRFTHLFILERSRLAKNKTSRQFGNSTLHTEICGVVCLIILLSPMRPTPLFLLFIGAHMLLSEAVARVPRGFQGALI